MRLSSIEKTDHVRYGREPVSDYWSAIWRLVPYLDSLGWTEVDDLPFAAELVCDIFWVTHAELRADLKKARGSF
ncbi:hypothetical protein [Pseudogemmobacter faecipullorum]|uniref:Uncharacterized protein n=1 Tax=Pseudogemmobacter faecipullorum TaxID=2755041 RepID=A0ABS8CLQ0_9RHOB|nr:hypothetical protein [Pseudogemmobacter faecipullorum]MCB5410301.1 hypothetical protein [Pseudogemmobacter faecipullorum]